MADIEFVIGAKDNATQPLAKVEKSLDKLGSSAKQVSETASKSLNKIDVSFASLAKGAGVLAAVDLAAQGIAKAISAVTGSISAANAAYDTQTEAVKGLETALALNGEEVEGQSARLQAFASDLQALTGVGDEVTLGLMKQASIMGIATSQTDDASKAAIGLAEATGKSLDESLKLVIGSIKGEFGAFGEIIPAIKNATSAEEKLAMVQQLSAKGLDAKTASADRLTGMTERANGAIGDMLEVVGALIAPIRMVAATGIKYLAEQMTTVLTPAVAMVESAFAAMQPVFDAVMDVINVMTQVFRATFDAMSNVVGDFIGGFGEAGAIFGTIADFIQSTAVSVGNGVIAAVTAMEVVYNNFGSVVQYAIDFVLLSYETYRADTEHLFVTTLPAYISWFADNFYNMIETAYNAVYTVIYNRVTNIIDVMASMWDFIASGGTTDILGSLGEIAGRSYLEGFESTIKDLPNIAARGMTAQEQELTSRLGQIGSKLGSEFNEKFNSRKIKLGEDLSKVLEEDLGKIDLKLGKESGVKNDAQIQASQGRLITRGPADKQESYMERTAIAAEKTAEAVDRVTEAQLSAASELAELRNQMIDNPNINLSPVT